MTRKERKNASIKGYVYLLSSLFLISLFFGSFIYTLAKRIDLIELYPNIYLVGILIVAFTGAGLGMYGTYNLNKVTNFKNNIKLWRHKHHARLMYEYIDKQNLEKIYWMFNEVISIDETYSDYFFLLAGHVLKYSSSEKYAEIGVKTVNKIKENYFNSDKIKF